MKQLEFKVIVTVINDDIDPEDMAMQIYDAMSNEHVFGSRETASVTVVKENN